MSMRFDYPELCERLGGTDLEPWLDTLPSHCEGAILHCNNGHLPKWRTALNALPPVRPSRIELDAAAIGIGRKGDLDSEQRAELKRCLGKFRPWRKGPFDFFGTLVDAEWRSDLKWDRVKGAIAPLAGRMVLDIGCGNGYYGWRMAGAGAKLVVGTDPFLLYVMQYFAAKRYIPDEQAPAYVLPFAIEDLPEVIPAFDTVFSMGVLYHRRSPLDHLLELKEFLRPGGELVLETLVCDGPLGHALLPAGRYAKMHNTWFIPSPLTLESWLKRCHYRNIRLADVSRTTPEEQRSTDWMRFESLSDFLDPEDPGKTIEGYPAPQRAVFVAEV